MLKLVYRWNLKIEVCRKFSTNIFNIIFFVLVRATEYRIIQHFKCLKKWSHDHVNKLSSGFYSTQISNLTADSKRKLKTKQNKTKMWLSQVWRNLWMFKWNQAHYFWCNSKTCMSKISPWNFRKKYAFCFVRSILNPKNNKTLKNPMQK